MIGKRILTAAAACAILLTACGSSDSSSDTDSKAESSVSESSSESKTEAPTADSSAADASSEKSSHADSTPDVSTAPEESEPEPAVSFPDDPVSEADDSSETPKGSLSAGDPGLISYVAEKYNAEQLSGKDVIKQMTAKVTSAPGTYAMSAEINTEDLFDPFDDLFTGVDLLAKLRDKMQVFILCDVAEVADAQGNKSYEGDSFLMAAAMGCGNEEDAKKLYDNVLNGDMKDYLKQLGEEEPTLRYEVGDDYMIMYMKDQVCYGYCLRGSSVYAAGLYMFDYENGTPVDKNYKGKYDLAAELKKMCDKLGVKSPTDLMK
ncbi:MAG: hypothetical protein IKN17_07900 [Ruminococcus sp.]|nr:hypothetical protein [Ruminococcus sp.]